MWWVDLAKSVVAILKDIVPIIRDVSLAIVPWLGLSTWRRQLLGTKRIEAAATLLKAVYELQRTLRVARHPAWSPHEASDRPRSDAEEQDEQRRHDRIYAYGRRFEEVWIKLDGLRLAVLNARVQGIRQAQDVVAGLKDRAADLLARHELWRTGLSQEGRERPEEVRELFSGGEDDAFTRQVNEAIEQVEACCEPWLR